MDPKPILVADDSDEDLVIFKRSLDEAGITNPVISVGTGRELIAYLTGQKEYSDRTKYPMPGLIFLDVRMPEMDGFEVLDWLRQHPELGNIPVVMLTGTMPLVEATRAYQKGAVSFLSKPCSPEHIKLLPDAAIRSLKFVLAMFSLLK